MDKIMTPLRLSLLFALVLLGYFPYENGASTTGRALSIFLQEAPLCIWGRTRMSTQANNLPHCNLNPMFMFSQEMVGEKDLLLRLLRHEAFLDYQCNITHKDNSTCYEDINCIWSATQPGRCQYYFDVMAKSNTRQISCQGSLVRETATCGILGSRGRCSEPCYETTGPLGTMCTSQRWALLDAKDILKKMNEFVQYGDDTWGRCPGRQAAILLADGRSCVTQNSTKSCDEVPGCNWQDNKCMPRNFIFELWRACNKTAPRQKVMAAIEKCQKLTREACGQALFSVAREPFPDDLTVPQGPPGIADNPGAIAGIVIGGVVLLVLVSIGGLLIMRMRSRSALTYKCNAPGTSEPDIQDQESASAEVVPCHPSKTGVSSQQ